MLFTVWIAKIKSWISPNFIDLKRKCDEFVPLLVRFSVSVRMPWHRAPNTDLMLFHTSFFGKYQLRVVIRLRVIFWSTNLLHQQQQQHHIAPVTNCPIAFFILYDIRQNSSGVTSTKSPRELSMK